MKKYAVISVDNMSWQMGMKLYETYEEAYAAMKKEFELDVAIELSHVAGFKFRGDQEEFDFSGYDDFIDLEIDTKRMHVYVLPSDDEIHYEIMEVGI